MKKLDIAALAVTSFDIPLPETQTEEWSSCFPDCGGFTLPAQIGDSSVC
jgi:hypothetical protein